MVYVADYSHGILRVEIETGTVARVRDAENFVSIGLDGIVWHEGASRDPERRLSAARDALHARFDWPRSRERRDDRLELGAVR